MTPVETTTDPALSAYGTARSTVSGSPLTPDELRRTHAYWRACNYLALGMIYLRRQSPAQGAAAARTYQEPSAGPLGLQPRPVLHLHPPEPPHQEIRSGHDLHGRPRPRRAGRAGPVLSGRHLLRVYPEKSEDEDGLREFFKQFSFPGGIGSHCTPETPGSIHEGGELGYVLSHACGAAFDNPDLIVAAVVGDGESETGPLATSWHINKFLNPVRDGAVLPILHLNGYKINNPTLLARISHEELENLFRGYGWTPYFVEGSDPDSMHQAMAATVEHCVSRDPAHPQRSARERRSATRPRWPMIVLRSPKGWTRARRSGRPSGWKAPGARTRCRCPT